MRFPLSVRTGFLLVVGLLIVIGILPATRADLIILKDGFALHGKVRRQTSTEFDPKVGLIQFAKINGFLWVDDEVRRMIFSPRQVHEEGIEDKALPGEAEQVRLTLQLTRLDGWRVPAGTNYADVTPFDDKWERTFKLDAPTGRINVRQRLITLTPHTAHVESLRYGWGPRYLTRELGPDVVQKLLRDYPEAKRSDKNDPSARFRAARFLLQAQWYDHAEREYQALVRDFPDQRDKVEKSLENLGKLRALQAVEEMERGQKAGRHAWVQGQLAAIPTSSLDERQVGRLQAVKALYETGSPNLVHARRLLKQLPSKLTSPGTREVLTEAAAAIAAEVSLESIGRLEAFVNLARQAERDGKGQTPEQLLSLAVTGWLLGNVSAESRADTAVRLWRVRQLVLEHQRTDSGDARDRIAQQVQQTGIAFDVLDRVIRHSPPPEPFPIMATQAPVVAAAWMNGAGVASGQLPPAVAAWPMVSAALPGAAAGVVTLRLTTDGLPPAAVTNRERAARYHLQLPPEYHHGRAWPVLIVLHSAGETSEETLRRWAAPAALNGYLLAAPEWGSGFRHAYDYSEEDHAVVLDVLRHLRQRFQVDNDRVFLAGWGEGGNMAFDVGLSHPDLFAGVMPIGGRPRYFAVEYWKNGQHLPFYVVIGDQAADSWTQTRRTFEHWVRVGYPMLLVEYKGRAVEWFGGELPYLFDWMGRKKRVTMPSEIGKPGGTISEEFAALRPTDDRFYWLGVSDLSERNQNEAGRWRRGIIPGSLHGRLGEGNRLFVTAHGFRRLTVWFGQGMIDFDKNVTVLVNRQQRWFNRKVTPNVATLLEDFYRRGDRQRLYWAKVEFSL
jgi:dienelactone hydrolase